MWPPRLWRERNALSRYWNALVQGAAEEELTPLAAALDAEQLALIDRLRTRPRYRPDPAFVARLERDLVRDLALTHTDTVPLSRPGPALVRWRPSTTRAWSVAGALPAAAALGPRTAAHGASRRRHPGCRIPDLHPPGSRTRHCSRDSSGGDAGNTGCRGEPCSHAILAGHPATFGGGGVCLED